MSLSPLNKKEWLKAQEAEKGHWAYLWQGKDSSQTIDLVNNERVKGEYIFQEMVDYFGVNPAIDWNKLKVLDVGCGPLSIVAQHSFGKKRSGVDPLKYPTWIYGQYSDNDFDVHLVPFEEFESKTKYDVIIFYNALQHFADLTEVADKCKQLLSNRGVVYLSEYLEVPTNEAHIQFLEAVKLDELFKNAGFHVNSTSLEVRLPGYVERPGGIPIDLYVAALKT